MELINNRYAIDGVDLLELTEKYGTPLYVYNAEKIKTQYTKLDKAFKGVNVKINYACKALTNINIIRLLNKLGAGFDAVSINEVKIALKAGAKPKDILFTPNGVSMQEIEEAIGLGVRINIDNISVLEQLGHKYGPKLPVGIRINPHVMGGGNQKISTGHIDSKFGISIYQMPHLKRVIEANNMNINGLHMHTGSDILDIEVFMRAVQVMLDTAREFPDLDYIDLGSGFKVPYKSDDIATDIELFGTEISKKFKEFNKSYKKDVQFIFEPGKYLVSEAGYFIVKVNVLKQTLATVFAGVDSGQNHLIRPMFYDAYHHITNISKPDAQPRIYTIVGYICETDTFGWNRKINEISEGDILCFHNAGAYCYMMASNYNSRLRPPEILIYKNKDYLIRKRETFEDLLSGQTEIDL